jgi:hypothetical protein
LQSFARIAKKKKEEVEEACSIRPWAALKPDKGQRATGGVV